MDYPKILIVNGQSLYEGCANGITLRNILKTYPNDKILELYFWKGPHITDGKIVIKSYLLSPWSRPIYHILRYVFGDQLASKFNESIVRDQVKGESVNLNRKERIKTFIRGLLDMTPIFYGKNVLQIIDNFRPDVIYTLGTTPYILKSAFYFSQRYKSKIILHFMDNWRETMYTSNRCLCLSRMFLNYYLKKVESQMKVGLCISETMATHYSRRSKVKYVALMNPIDKQKIRLPYISNNKELKVIYTGGLHLNRYRSLIDVEDCISKINKQGISSKLYIYCSDTDRDKYSKLFNIKNTCFIRYLPHNRVYEAYDDADILIHIESFDVEQALFTKYSLSTKISEYLSSGKPVICYAPKELAVFEYIKGAKVGYSVSSKQELFEKLLLLAQNENLRLSLANNGVELAKKRHTIEKAGKIFSYVVNESVTPSGRQI